MRTAHAFRVDKTGVRTQVFSKIKRILGITTAWRRRTAVDDCKDKVRPQVERVAWAMQELGRSRGSSRVTGLGQE